jgi:predicted transcriptional regulator of viral defense system
MDLSAQPLSTSPPRYRTLTELVDALQASGRYVFRREEALGILEVSEGAFKQAAHRLAVKRRIVAPRRSFIVVVPLEYRSAGAPPPSWFIADLMAFHDQPYYVGLLSAAALHGAAHQQPQEFQVITDRPLRPALAGGMRLRFFKKRRPERTATIDVKTETGTMRVSTPEATALDLLRYVGSTGGLGNVATVLAELAERIDGERLVEAAKAEELSVAQRLGFLLELVEATETAAPLRRWIATQQPRPTLLRPDVSSENTSRSLPWQVIVNETVEPDL